MDCLQQSCSRPNAAHVDWIDCAKGFTIVLVVMLYANEWAERATDARGWLRHIVEFAAPFRMPDFFLISGVLLSFSIQRDWRTYLDRKVLHFAYFYVLWLTILVAFEAPWTAAKHGWPEVAAVYFKSFVRPYSMLWFIYLLPVFFVVTKLVHRAPVALVWLLAAALQIGHVETQVKLLDKFVPYYVFFYTGYALAPHIFRLSRAASGQPAFAFAVLALWALLNFCAVLTGYADAPGVGLALGLLGAGAIIVGSALLSGTRAATPLAYLGRNSIVIYLGFYIPLVVGGQIALSSGLIGGSAALALLGTVAALAAPLALHRLVRGTRLAFLFERPRRLWLARPLAPARSIPAHRDFAQTMRRSHRP